MKNLTDWFDRVYVISCKHRPDRLEATMHHLTTSGMADPSKVRVQPGVIGAWTTVPKDWLPGLGAWGCWRSHVNLLEDVLMDRDSDLVLQSGSTLILEDDVFFVEGSLEKLNAFMSNVPADWDQLYLGGQHKMNPTVEKPGILRGKSVNRTHAHAVRGKAYETVYQHITLLTGFLGTHKHVDHHLEEAHQRRLWNVYCPDKWIAGQRENISIITGQQTPEKVWQL